MTRVSSIRLGFLVLVATAVSACGPQPTQPKPTGEVNIEGLQRVSARNFEAAFVRPGVTFANYGKLMVDELELAFRTPDREQNQFPLGEDQKTRFRAAMATAFGEEFGKLENVEVVTEPGPDVLALHVRVQDRSAVALPEGPALPEDTVAGRFVADLASRIGAADDRGDAVATEEAREILRLGRRLLLDDPDHVTLP